jgi:hypothetical protein
VTSGSIEYVVDTDGDASDVVKFDRYSNTITDPASLDAVRGAALNGVVPATRDSAGIAAAVAQIVASGKPGAVLYEAEDYAITASQPFVSGVSHLGAVGQLTMNGDIPDADFTVTGGTRFIQSAGVTGFVWNNVDKGSDETDIAENACLDFTVDGITFIGGVKAIDTGAQRAMGAMRCRFTRLYGMEQTADHAFDFKNFQHCYFDEIYTSTQLTSGSGVRFASQLSSALLPGNSEIGEIYTYCKNRKNRSITIEATGPAGCVLNQMKVRGRLQGNRYGAAAVDAITATTDGTASIAVPDASVFQVGVPVVFAATAPTNFTVGVVYFVRTLNTGTNRIELIESPWETTSVVAGSSASYTLSYGGWPSIQIWANNSANSVKNSDFGQLDCEAFHNVTALVIAKTRNCVGFLSEIMDSDTSTALVCRDAEIALQTAGHDVTQDQSASFGYSSVWSSPKPFVYSGGSFTLDNTWNGRCVRYTGTADITITVPNTLPKGFTFEITPTSTTSLNVSTTSGSANATTTSTTNLAVGAYITGNANIPAGARVASITNATDFVLSIAATATASGVATVFGRGNVTFAAGSGGAIFSFGNKLRTAGHYATARLSMIANKVSALTGDLQV